MMAPAMASDSVPCSTSCPTKGPRCTDLARAGAQFERQLAGDRFVRLQELTEAVDELQVTFRFELDQQNRPEVHVRGSVQLELPCQWCLMAQAYPLDMEFSSTIAPSEAVASEWYSSDPPVNPVVVLEDDVFDALTLLEDELILLVPAQVCEDATCVRRPATEYGDADTAAAQAKAAEGPFAGLADLIRSQDDTS